MSLALPTVSVCPPAREAGVPVGRKPAFPPRGCHPTGLSPLGDVTPRGCHTIPVSQGRAGPAAPAASPPGQGQGRAEPLRGPGHSGLPRAA